MKKLTATILTSMLFAPVVLHPALADGWHGHGDIHHFREYDYGYWRGGYWSQGFHEGRHGWWWVVGPSWYYYPAPVYPYPDPYIPPGVVVEAMPVAPVSSPPSYAYYCSNPAGYYPYVGQCYRPWRRVLTTAGQPVIQQQVVVQNAPQPMPSSPAPAVGIRETDDRQLNAYAAEFQNMDMKDKHARSRLKNLEKRVEAYRQSLYEHNYNAMDILHDAEDLQHRIQVQIDMLSGHSVNATPAAAAEVAPAPNEIMTVPQSVQPDGYKNASPAGMPEIQQPPQQ